MQDTVCTVFRCWILCILFSDIGYCVYCFQMLDTVYTVFRCWILCILFSDVGYYVYCFQMLDTVYTVFRCWVVQTTSQHFSQTRAWSRLSRPCWGNSRSMTSKQARYSLLITEVYSLSDSEHVCSLSDSEHVCSLSDSEHMFSADFTV